jgi:hypothetical protein
MPGIPGMAVCLILPNKSSWGELTPDPVRNHMAESAIKVPSPVSLRLTQQAKLSVQCQLFFWPFTKAYKESISTEFGHVLIIVVKSLHFCIWNLTYVILIIRVSGTCKISIGSLLQAMLPVYLLPAIWTQCSPSSQCFPQHVLSIAPHFYPICFGKCCPSFTYIGGPKGMSSTLKNRTFYFGEPP